MIGNAEWEALMSAVNKLHKRNEFAAVITPDFYEPGMMEYLKKSDGSYDPETGELLLKFEAKGTRYEGRTERIENVKTGDAVIVLRDAENAFNPNNFTMTTAQDKNIGHMPAELCNALAPFYDAGMLTFESAAVSYVEPISARSRYAKQAMLFVEVRGRLKRGADNKF